jgi:hypothetical protein
VLTITTIGMRTIGATGTRSRTGSKGSLMPAEVWLIDSELLITPMV